MHPYGTRWRRSTDRLGFQHPGGRGRRLPLRLGYPNIPIDGLYGFVGGDTSQWEPNLFRNTRAIHGLRRVARRTVRRCAVVVYRC